MDIYSCVSCEWTGMHVAICAVASEQTLCVSMWVWMEYVHMLHMETESIASHTPHAELEI